MNNILEVEKLNEVYVQIRNLDKGSALELKEFLSCYIDNYWFHPLVRSKQWDGRVSFFNWNEQTIPIGLLPQFVKFCRKFDYEYKLNFSKEEIVNDISEDDFEEFYEAIFKESSFSPRDYQDDCIKKALRIKRGVIESPTGSGKSLIIYSMIRFIMGTSEGKILLIVPNISLVNQMFNDFKEYGWNQVETYCSLVFHKSKKINWDCPIIISTWQSIYKKGSSFFDKFGSVIVDECLHPSTIITMSDGSKKRIDEIKVGEKILSYNLDKKILETDEVIKVYENLQKSSQEEMHELEFDNGIKIQVTGNHKILTKNRGYIRADEINEKDDVIFIDNIEKIINSNIENKIKNYMKLVKRNLIEKSEKVFNLHVKNNNNYFANGICVSNCHGAKSNSIRTCLEKCVNADYRIGLTGTMPDQKLDSFTIFGYLGPKIFEMKSSELIEKGILSKIKIANIVIKYPKDIIDRYWRDSDDGNIKQNDYNEELNDIYEFEERNKVFNYIIDKLDKSQNILILCHKISHLKDIKKYLEDNFPSYDIHEIYGKTAADERERIRQLLDESKIKIFLDEDSYIVVNKKDKVKLTNGQIKTGANININDDIDDNWIKSKKVFKK